MSAGPTYEKYGFPPNSKPKCLFHYQGKVILETQVQILTEAGINDIIIVAGYKIDMIQKFNKDKKLGLKVLYNPSAISDTLNEYGWAKGIETAKIGVKSADDDVLLIMGDVLLTVEGIKNIVEDDCKCISVYSGHGLQLYKIPKELIPLLIKCSGGPGGMTALHYFCMNNGGIRMAISLQPMPDAWMIKCETKWVKSFPLQDLDYYYMTDEGKAQGVTPENYRKGRGENIVGTQGNS